MKNMVFRIELDLTNFFSDHRKSVFVIIDSNWKNVKCLEDHILQLFKLPNSIYLTIEGKLIPPLEAISVILPTDILKAVPIKKYEDIENRVYNEKNIELSRTSLSINTTKNEEEIDQPIVPEFLGDSETKKKRKRKRQKKKVLDEALSFEELGEKLCNIFSQSQSNDENPSKKAKTHIRFDESTVEALDFRPRVVRAIEIDDISFCEVEKDISTTREEHMDTLEEVPVKLHVNGNGVTSEYSNEEVTKESSLDTIRQNCDSLNLPSIIEIPKENDVVLFRYLRIGPNYIPEISEPIIGMIESVDYENNNLKIYILSGNEKLIVPDGKFSMPDELEPDNNSLLLNWSELINPKQVKLD